MWRIQIFHLFCCKLHHWYLSSRVPQKCDHLHGEVVVDLGVGRRRSGRGGEGGGGGGVLQSVAHTDYAVEISRIYITVH